MPAYLSDANRRYNQARKISANDPISKLNYYLPSSKSCSAGSSPPTSGESVRFNDEESDYGFQLREQLAGRGDRRRLGQQTVDSISSYEAQLAEHLSRQQKKRRRQLEEVTSKNASPATSSGFDELPTTTTTTKNGLGREEATTLHGQLFASKQSLANNLVKESPYASTANNRLGQAAKSYVLNGKAAGQNGASPQKATPENGRRRRHYSRRFGARMKRRNMKLDNNGLILGDGGGVGSLGNEENNNNNHLMMINPYALSELFSQSEIPGFREIFASDSYLRKFCWIIAFLFMTILSLNDMTELITEYYEYPITVDLRLRDSARLPFPAVTVCNLNIVRFSALCSASARFDLTNQIPSELRDKLCGIQVEKNKKKKNQTDTDISDINNIGITTTTTTTPATTLAPPAVAAATTTTSTTTDSNSSLASVTTSSPQSTPMTSLELPPEAKPTNNHNHDDDNEGGGVGGADQSAARRPATLATTDAKLATPTPAQITFMASTYSGQMQTSTLQMATTRRTTAKGSLDLSDDFVAPGGSGSQSLLQQRTARRQQQQWSAAVRGRRSIQLSEGADSLPARPFASSKSRLLPMRPPLATTTSPSDSNNNNNNFKRHSSAGQLNKVSQVNLAANRVSGLSSQPRPNNWQPNNGNNNNHNNNSNSPPNNNNFPPNPLAKPGLGGGGGGLGGGSGLPAGAPAVNLPTSSTPPVSPAALPEDFELTERQERELQENLTNWLAVMYNRDPQLTWSLGHQFDDMILRCTMKSINCTRQRSFENSFSPTEGNCFTYRSRVRRVARGGAGHDPHPQHTYEDANLAGTNQGLELVLNLEKSEYISGSSQVGALVMVHHPGDLGYAASEATFVAPEFTTYIGVKMVNITRLPAPYPEYCVDSWPAKFADTLTHNSTYSQQACLKICLQKTIQSHCQCQSAFLPVVELDQDASSPSSHLSTETKPPPPASKDPPSGPLPSNQPMATGTTATSNQQQPAPPNNQENQQRIIICDTRRLGTRQCVREVMFRAADRVHNCECPPKCQVVRYDKTISMARWPTREDKVSFDRGKTDVNFQNLAKVIVYFQTMTCEEVTQQAVFNAAKLFSALGGIMGMYVGFSFLSVFEIFEVMSRKLWHYMTVKISRATSRISGEYMR